MDKILVVAAHPDDEILGLGGTIRKHSNKGDLVHCIILGEGLTSRGNNRGDTESDALNSLHKNSKEAAFITGYEKITFFNLPDNRFDSLDILDLIKIIEEYITLFEPKVVYTHHYGDLNVDHKITFQAVITACRPINDCCVKEIYAFETPSSTEWNFKYGEDTFKPNVFIDISDTITEKLKAMQCYHTEIRDYPHPRSLEALKVIASRWGTVCGKTYAEAFQLIRKID